LKRLLISLRLSKGLAFLAKKSWHTSNLNNQERVWLAEQKAAAEEKKMKELQKQIKLEREREEFQRLAGKSKSGTGDRGRLGCIVACRGPCLGEFVRPC